MIQRIMSDKIAVAIDADGAELKSVINRDSCREYLWYGDENYWKRTSPILFPFVGITKDKKFIYNGKEYPVSQHGFARDNTFEVVECKDNEIWFAFVSNDKTRQVYPFDFKLMIGYKVEENKLSIRWKVINCSEGKMYFSIGAHPAFLCEKNKVGYKLYFKEQNEMHYRGINQNTGLAFDEDLILSLENQRVTIDKDFFDRSALIFEKNQPKCVGIEDRSGKRVVDVCFDSPLFAIWSPEKKNAPFICIEPWYGRCDSESFVGDLTSREFSNVLDENETFDVGYEIVFYD